MNNTNKYTLHDYVGLYCRRSNTKSNIEFKKKGN